MIKENLKSSFYKPIGRKFLQALQPFQFPIRSALKQFMFINHINITEILYQLHDLLSRCIYTIPIQKSHNNNHLGHGSNVHKHYTCAVQAV